MCICIKLPPLLCTYAHVWDLYRPFFAKSAVGKMCLANIIIQYFWGIKR